MIIQNSSLYLCNCTQGLITMTEFSGQNYITLKNQEGEEGGAQLTISFWHLLMNLKNNYLLTKLLKWANKKRKNFNIYNIVFFKKIKRNTWRYHKIHLCTKNLDDLIYCSWDIERDGLKLTILGHYFPFQPPKPPKNQNFEKYKNIDGDIIILHMCTINHDHVMYGSRDMERDRQNFLSFWTIFCPITPLTTRKIKVLKKWKKQAWRYHHFTQKYQKSWSYATPFLRYGAQRTDKRSDRRTDGREKWHIEVGAQLKSLI